MTGYVRQSSADIVPTAVVRAAPINNEYNALRDAFEQTAGHKHDGTAAEGHYVPLIADSDARNKVAVDTVNNRVGVFVEVGGAAVEQVRVQDGAIVPVIDNDIDLGTSLLEFKDLYIDGTANIDSLIADTADINAGTIDNTVVGATTPAAATVTNLTVNTAAVIASVDVNAGTIDGAVIGGASAQAITGTLITATTNFAGNLTGAVTGNTAGTHTGPVIGAVTGDLTGNVTASTGTSSFNDVTINGGLNMNAGTAATITNLTSPTNAGDAATKGYVDTSIANLIDTAPGTLDTLNELAAALGDDPNFATTVTASIATKLALAGGTMSGAIAMGTNKITGVGDPTANQDAATKTYVDTADALKLSLTGGTMSGAIAMGTNKITGLGTPTVDADATTKLYVDGILGSATAAATSAAAAATSASNAATSETNALSSANAASASAVSAAASYDAFDDRYLGSKTSDPTLDNDGNALITGALYFNSTVGEMRVWDGSAWLASYLPATGYLTLSGGTMTGVINLAAAQVIPVGNGGTGATTLTANNVLLGNGTSALQVVAPGASGNVLTSNGTTWSSSTPSGNSLTISDKTAAYTVVAGDLGKIINCSGATSFTVSLTASATLGSGFNCWIWNTSTTGTTAITIDPSGAETIDGVATLILRNGEGAQIICNGTNFQTGDKKVMRGYAENINLTSTRPIASGSGGVAIGWGSNASGSDSMAAGRSATASGLYSFAGPIGTASAANSVALGMNSGGNGSQAVTGSGAMALGGSYASGTDSFAAAIGNNTSTYGALSSNGVAIGNNNRASVNNYNTSIGGFANVSSAAWSTCIGGRSCTAGFDYSIALGYAAVPNAIGKITFGNTNASFSGNGWGKLNLFAATTNATATKLSSDTLAAAANNQLIVTNNTAYAFTGTVVARQSSANGTASAAWKVEGLIRREGTAATTTLVASTVTAISNVPAWTLALSADTTNGGLSITATGAAATNIRWIATINTSEVTYA